MLFCLLRTEPIIFLQSLAPLSMLLLHYILLFQASDSFNQQNPSVFIDTAARCTILPAKINSLSVMVINMYIGKGAVPSTSNELFLALKVFPNP